VIVMPFVAGSFGWKQECCRKISCHERTKRRSHGSLSFGGGNDESVRRTFFALFLSSPLSFAL